MAKLLFIISFLFTSHLFSQTNYATLLDHKNIPHGISPQQTYFSSCWGWVSPEGKEYAFIGCATGTSIYAIEDDTLREIQFVTGPMATYAYREFKTYKNYLYAVSEGGSGVQIIDLSQLPDTAILVKNFNYTRNGKNILKSHTVTLADGYLYLNGCANWSPGGMVIFSLKADPTTPQYVGQYQPDYIHDSYVKNDTIFGAAIYWGGGLYIADVSDKSNPTTINLISYDGSGTHHAWETIDGNYALTTDEIGTVNNLKIWDFKNPGSGPPYTPTAQYSANPTDIIHNVHGRGNYAYVSHYGAGARVVDIHNPTQPNEVGYYDTYPGSVNDYEGCWAVYPYYFSNKWIASDMNIGLYLMDFSLRENRVRPNLLTPENNVVIDSLNSTFSWTSSANQSEDPHWYEIRISGNNFSKTFKTLETSFILTDFSDFVNDETYTWEVYVVDEFTEVKSLNTFQFVFNGIVGVSENINDKRSFSVLQNYPNPFNPVTKINFSLSENKNVTLKIYNSLGQEIETLLDGFYSQGNYEIVWDASRFASGIYFYKLTSGNFIEMKKMILNK